MGSPEKLYEYTWNGVVHRVSSKKFLLLQRVTRLIESILRGDTGAATICELDSRTGDTTGYFMFEQDEQAQPLMDYMRKFGDYVRKQTARWQGNAPPENRSEIHH
jgi:hypothetical protein